MLAQRLTQMETRLNLTLQENVDLRATIQNSRRPKRSLERKGRNFLASTATSDFLIKKPVVAFDAYRYYTFEYIKALSLLYGLVYSKSLNAKALKGSSFVVTVFENHPKCLIWIFQFWHFPLFFVLLNLTCLVTLFDPTSFFSKLAEIDSFFLHF